MDQNLPGNPTPSTVPPVQPTSSVPPSQPIPTYAQPTQSTQAQGEPNMNDMAARRKTELKITTGVLLAFIAGLVLSGIYFTKVNPASKSPTTVTPKQVGPSGADLARKSPPKTDNKFEPIPALTALTNCGLTPDAQKIVDQDFILNGGLTMGIVGTITDLTYPSTTQASLTLQKRNNNDTITLPVKVENDGIIKKAKLVTTGENQPNTETIDSLKKGDLVTVTMLCRSPRAVNTQFPSSTLTTISIKR